MKLKLFLPALFFLLISCKKEAVASETFDTVVSKNVVFSENNKILKLKSGKFTYDIPKSKLPFKRIILLNASLVGYFSELRQEEKIIGISSPEYIYSEKIQQLITENKIQNVGNEQKYDVEKILALKPDAIFTNYISSFENTYDLLKKNGIEVIFLDEYLEQNPLEKSKYLLVFGKLLDVEKTATEKFGGIEKTYDSLKTLVKNIKEKPVVLANEIYGNQWFMPGGKTQLAYLINDAGGKYILKENTDDKAVPMSFEEVFVKAERAKFWVNAGNHKTKNELLTANPNYAKMNVFKTGRIYAISGREKGKTNDFFESGAVRSDLVLKDYIKIFHPQLLPNYQLTYLKELN